MNEYKMPSPSFSSGCCLRFKFSPEEMEQRYRSREIDKMIEKDKNLMRKQVKLLLLGAGESGKSTFLKQMKIIHGIKFDTEQLHEYQIIIYQNIIRGMKVLVDARNKLNIPWENLNNEEHGRFIMKFENHTQLDSRLFLAYAPSLYRLWSDAAIRRAYDRRREFQLSDSVFYFLENLERISRIDLILQWWVVSGQDVIAISKFTNYPVITLLKYFFFGISTLTVFRVHQSHSFTGVKNLNNNKANLQMKKLKKKKAYLPIELPPDYMPTNKDILHARKATKGISEFTIPINNIIFRFVDVGGQRSQRQKWFQCFESITSILFLVSSSEFDQVLVEDRKTNRLEESKNIFDTIVNNVIFRRVSIILFLNKTDLLIEKLKSKDTDIRWYFPEFEGDPTNIVEVQQFLLNYFKRTKRDSRKQLFHHFTTAVDTENIKVVFNAVKDTILHRNLESLMLQ